jgi:hypothetical protein
MKNGIYTDIDEYISAVDESDDVHRDHDLTGAKMGSTVGTLLSLHEEMEIKSVVTSSRHDTPHPLGAEIKVTSLHELADLADKLGLNTVADLQCEDDGGLLVGYHFD